MNREATLDDIEMILKFGERFFYQSGYEDIVKYNKESFRDTIIKLIDDDNGILIINEGKGMVGALIYPFYFNYDHITGQELFWWVEPEHRKSNIGKSLLIDLERKAKERGAKSFTMIALNSLSPESVGEIYLKNGYRKSEHSYIKAL